ncbi:hypothetical protein ebA6422 [Aromatoleum aromaticum EbN1]|uniref:Uncharacterized protein n=1 Tax=Aromatoleum aromaticum (strain DSM 19018 / LMG 30748 / EbN1) TaxID=76114 RepID=Q5NYR5_AROAE|nr:HisA/HisF-related TIM barrel protein [Aromatoleum aromaticum]CAI09799.1 hypothetical protein ebA6422 [Aromatoleum aromaticum EbN1]
MIRCACLVGASETPPDVDAEVFVIDGDAVGARLASAVAIILPAEGEARASELLAAGARRVLLGEAALRDAELVPRLVARFGAERIGVFVPARRMEVAWSFDMVSNADFRVVTPSLCEAGWEILRADDSATDIRANWWLGEMKKRGVSIALVQVDIVDDTDLNLCAGLVEDLGERLWIAPRRQSEPALADWVAYGKAAQIALSPSLFARRAELLPAVSPSDAVSPAVEDA